MAQIFACASGCSSWTGFGLLADLARPGHVLHEASDAKTVT